VFAFDPLTLTLSLLLCASIHIAISYTCLACLCVAYLLFNFRILFIRLAVHIFTPL